MRVPFQNYTNGLFKIAMSGSNLVFLWLLLDQDQAVCLRNRFVRELTATREPLGFRPRRA